MTRSNTITPENRGRERIFSSPVALAFVRTVVARRGISEAQAKQVYRNYLNRAQPAVSPRAPERHAMT